MQISEEEKQRREDAEGDVEEQGLLESTDAKEEQEDEGKKGEEGSEEGEEVTSVEKPSGTGEVVVTIGDDPSDEDEENASPVIRHLRKSHRSLQKENRQLKQRLEQQPSAAVAVAPGKRPTFEGCDWDNEEYERQTNEWLDKSKKYDQEIARRNEAEEDKRRKWERVQGNYAKAKSELQVPDYDVSEETVQSILSPDQQSFLLQAADRPEMVVYALGRSPKRLQELAAKDDPFEFSKAIIKLEGQLKVKPKKAATTPEGKVKGSASVSGAVGNQLERLRAEADKTGDRTKVRAYLREMRNREKAA